MAGIIDIGGAVGTLIDKIGGTIDEFWHTDEEKAAARQALALAQLEINKVEAAHRSLFVAGWRPAIGWACGAALVFTIIGIPFIKSILAGLVMLGWVTPDRAAEAMQILPEPNMEWVLAVLSPLLGFGGYRTFEKVKNVAK